MHNSEGMPESSTPIRVDCFDQDETDDYRREKQDQQGERYKYESAFVPPSIPS
jgi:hypothetical protein